MSANHHHHFSYTEKERRKRQNPESILSMAGLKEGMCFIDSGCNDGFFTLPAARMVGRSGKVYAIDIDEEALDRLKTKLDNEGIQNTTIINKPSEKVMIDTNIADLIFFGIVLHDFYDPSLVLNNSKQMLKDNGLIFDYDWQKIDTPLGPPFSKRFSQEHVKELADQAGLTIVSSNTIGNEFYGIALSKPKV